MNNKSNISTLLFVAISAISSVVTIFGFKLHVFVGISILSGLVFASIIVFFVFHQKSKLIEDICRFLSKRNLLSQKWFDNFFYKKQNPKETILMTQKSKSIDGIIRFLPERSGLNQDWWNSFFDKKQKPKEVVLMGQSLSRAFEEDAISVESFVEWANNGTTINILFLSPESPELSQLHSVGIGMKDPPSNNPNKNLQEKINQSIRSLVSNVISKIHNDKNKPLVRYSTKDLPYSIVTVDDHMVVTFYGVGAEGNNQPTIIIKGKDTSAFKKFMEEFSSIWKEHSKVNPFENPLVTYFKSNWVNNIDALRSSWESLHLYKDIPRPNQVIIFPTYNCKEQCSYCSFEESRKDSKKEDLDISTEKFEKILFDFAKLGIKKIEISGGGEPLEHSNFKGLLEHMKTVHEKYPDVYFGLLTNGINTGDLNAKDLLHVFNGYIRFSRYEDIESKHKNSLKIWRNNLKKLLETKRTDPRLNTEIGIKYLLTPNNKEGFIDMVKSDLEDNDIANVDYIRFTSVRQIKEKDAITIEQQLYYYFKEIKMPHLEKIVSLSLQNFKYPQNHRCWISPISVTIDPNCKAFMCCNFNHRFDKDDKCLGIIEYSEKNDSTTFLDIWNCEHHNELRKQIEKNNCDRDEYCNCRFAEMQELFERCILPISASL